MSNLGLVLEETNGKETVAMSSEPRPCTLAEVGIIAIGQPTAHPFIYSGERLVRRIPKTSKTIFNVFFIKVSIFFIVCLSWF